MEPEPSDNETVEKENKPAVSPPRLKPTKSVIRIKKLKRKKKSKKNHTQKSDVSTKQDVKHKPEQTQTVTLVERTTTSVVNPLFHSKQKADNEAQNSSAISANWKALLVCQF